MNRVKFGDVVQEIKINVDRTTDDHEYFIAGEHMDSSNIHITRRGRFSESDVGPAFIRLFRPGQVLYGSRRTYLRKVAVADFEGITSNTTFVLETKDSNRLLQELLPYIMLTDRFSEYAINNSKGSTNPYILFKDLAAYEFDLPTIEEQRQLVVLLSACDRAKEAYKRLLKQTDEVVKSQFIALFGDPFRNEKGWNLIPLSDVADIRIGPFGSLLHKEDYIQNGHALVNPSHIVEGVICPDPNLTVSDEKYQELSAYHLKIGDIVLGRRGEMGRCAVVTAEGMLCGTGSMIIRPNAKMKPYFLNNILSSPSYKQVIESKAVGVTMMNMNVPLVSSLTIPELPMGLQEEFICFIQQSDKSKFELTQAISRIDDMIKALMQG